jgi:hypothetical protein
MFHPDWAGQEVLTGGVVRVGAQATHKVIFALIICPPVDGVAQPENR